MTEAIVAGAVAGAIAGAIVALAVALTLRRRDGGWRSSVVRTSHTYQGPRSEFGPGLGPPGPYTGGSSPFDRFNERSKRVLALAQDEAIRMNHNYIGTEHLLLGLIREGESVAARALDALNVDLSKVRTAVEFIIGRGPSATAPSEITLSPRTKRVLELAVDEAHKLGHSHVGTEHLLLALAREGEGIASGVLESLGVSMERVRQQVIATLGSSGATPSGPVADDATRPARGYRGPFDRFNDRAKRVLALAQDEAIRLNHNYMGPEHVLLGLVREGEGVAGRILATLGVDLKKTREAVERVVGRGESTTSPTEITLTPRTKMVIELAIDEARKLGHEGIATEHLLLGILRDNTSIACRVLVEQGAPLEKVRAYVDAALGRQPPPADAPSNPA